MSEPGPLATTSPRHDDDTAIEVSPASYDIEYDFYALPGRRLAYVVLSDLVPRISAAAPLFLPLVRPIIVPLCLSLISIFAVAIVAAVPLAAMGDSNVPIKPLIAGSAVILGGAFFDIYPTVTHSPDLVREGNPVIRGLL